jgi:hypothetical protein
MAEVRRNAREEGDRSCVGGSEQRRVGPASFLKPRVSRLRLEWLKNQGANPPKLHVTVQPASSYGRDNREISSRHFVDVGNPDWDEAIVFASLVLPSWRTTLENQLKSPTLLATRASTPEAYTRSTAATSETPHFRAWLLRTVRA